MSEAKFVYCPRCEGVLMPPVLHASPRTLEVVGRCPRCQGEPMLWPADLPPPTQANVRALWGFVRSGQRKPPPRPRLTLVVGGAGERAPGQRAPESNPRGRWNG